MKVAICDDDVVIGQELKAMICQMPGIEGCKFYSDGEILLKDIEEDDVYDVIMMDIQWEGKEKGISWSVQLQKLLPEVNIIYVTGYAKEYVQQIFLSPSNPSGFLTKPVNPEILQKNLLKIALEKSKFKKSKFVFCQRGEWYTLCYDEIEYFESKAHKVYVHTQMETFEYYGKLEQIIDICPDCFLQCHKSYFVNLNKVQQFGAVRRFVMENGKEISISKRLYPMVKERYFDYIRKNSLRKDL